jgi:hypothetical protein
VVGLLPEMLINPLRALSRVAREHPGKVIKMPFGLVDIHLVTHPEHAGHVLLDNWRNYPKGNAMWRPVRRLFGQGLATSEGELWVKIDGSFSLSSRRSTSRPSRPQWCPPSIGAWPRWTVEYSPALLCSRADPAARGADIQARRSDVR